MEFLRPYRNAVARGLLSYEHLPVDRAAQMVRAANNERFTRRQLTERIEDSPAEIDLVAGLLYIGATGFTLQHPIGPYDADLYFPAERLVIEVDGRDFHDAKTDRRRDDYMRTEHQIHTVRYRAAEVWRDPIEVAQNIAYQVGIRRAELREEAA